MTIRVPLLFPRRNMDNTYGPNYALTKPMMCFKDHTSEWRHQEWKAHLRWENEKVKKR